MTDIMSSSSLNELLLTTTQAWGLTLSQQQIDQFAHYAQELQSWNERLNLTAITDARGIYVRHFLDSLSCARSWGQAPSTLIDIGTGAGFPGLPLKILQPDLHLTLVESIAKKATFLRAVADELGLSNVDVQVARAETIGREPSQRERYDVVTARAVAELRVLAEYCLPLCRVGGLFLAPKGGQSQAEIAEAQQAIGLLGGAMTAITPVELPEVEPRCVVVISKHSATPPAYPRAIGVPTKRPL